MVGNNKSKEQEPERTAHSFFNFLQITALTALFAILMSFVISAFQPFPPVHWWAAVADAGTVLFDRAEHFQKMSARNRYHIASANGPLTLSIPLEEGRDQRKAMSRIRICNKTNWQVQHWRTIISAYRRTPFFEYYEHSLAPLFGTRYELLTDYDLATVQWLKKQLKKDFEEQFAEVYVKNYPEAQYDLRGKTRFTGVTDMPPYYQLFADRHGFLPGLSMLDLLFSEGPHAMQWIMQHRDALLRDI
jgi:hypothetical protein